MATERRLQSTCCLQRSRPCLPEVRFCEQDQMPSSLWWLKVQHDTLQQAFANSGYAWEGRCSGDQNLACSFGSVKDDCGYFEDRRPASNMDPYVVTAKLVETTVLGGKAAAALAASPEVQEA